MEDVVKNAFDAEDKPSTYMAHDDRAFLLRLRRGESSSTGYLS